MQEEEKRRC